jgi:O-antigen/teichoic acid export membrane protein
MSTTTENGLKHPPRRNRLFVFVETMGAQIVGALLSVTNVAIATHALSRPEAGVFFILMGIAIIGGTIGSLGFTSASAVILGRALAADEPARVRGAAEAMLAIVIIANVILAGAILGVGQSDWILHVLGVKLSPSQAVPVVIQLAGVALGLACPAILLALGYARRTAWLRYALPNMLTAILLFACRFVVQPTLEAALWCYAIGFIVPALMGAAQVGLIAIKLAPQSKRPRPGDVLALSLPLTVAQLQVNLIDYGILWVAALVIPIGDIALLGMAQRIASGCQIAFRSSVLLYMPTAARMFSAGKYEDLRALSRVTGFLTAAPSLALMIATIPIGQFVLGVVFGAQYRDAWLPLVLLFAGFAGRGLAGPGEYLLQITGRHYTVIVGNTLYLLTMMVAAYALGPRAGAVGVAGVIAGCTFFQQGIYFLLCRYWYGFNVGATFRYREIRRGLTEIQM